LRKPPTEEKNVTVIATEPARWRHRPLEPITAEQLDRIDAWWRAANYLSIGQIYLLDNPLLREPLRTEHIKPRLLGHWGTTPGLNFLYAHLNRAIQQDDLDTIFVTGPGHGGPGMVANAFLDGTYSELYSEVDQSEEGIRRMFRRFSFPGGIPSHASPDTPGSIHEGGELGYALSHAYGAAFDNEPAGRLRHRRRRGRDRPAGHQLALQQVREPGAGWRGPADPAPQRL
jgi:xylulose-5-phosphate/fructose-6-phosphate phosphoketolase